MKGALVNQTVQGEEMRPQVAIRVPNGVNIDIQTTIRVAFKLRRRQECVRRIRTDSGY